jgi:hypothetical protein
MDFSLGKDGRRNKIVVALKVSGSLGNSPFLRTSDLVGPSGSENVHFC